MANLWTYEQKFNDLNSSSLGGQDSWALLAGTGDTVTTSGTPYEGAKHEKIPIVSSSRIILKRQLPATIESGTFYFSIKMGSTKGYQSVFINNQNDQNDLDFFFYNDGYIKLYSGGTLTTLQAYSADTYYRIGVRFEYSTNGYEGLAQRKWQVNVDGGAWSTAYNTEKSTGTGAKYIYLDMGQAGGTYDVYFDFISPDYSASAIKIINGLAKASVKTVNNLAIASVKTWNGLA